MKYTVYLKRSAEKEIDALPEKIYKRVIEKILALRENPRPSGCRKLISGTGYRLRVGDYRIIYTIDDKAKRVEIFAVIHRGKAYRKNR